jgi:hypothetical protein
MTSEHLCNAVAYNDVYTCIYSMYIPVQLFYTVLVVYFLHLSPCYHLFSYLLLLKYLANQLQVGEDVLQRLLRAEALQQEELAVDETELKEVKV